MHPEKKERFGYISCIILHHTLWKHLTRLKNNAKTWHTYQQEWLSMETKGKIPSATSELWCPCAPMPCAFVFTSKASISNSSAISTNFKKSKSVRRIFLHLLPEPLTTFEQRKLINPAYQLRHSSLSNYSKGIFPLTALSILGICQTIDSPMSRLM
jgi:hypothetical protein